MVTVICDAIVCHKQLSMTWSSRETRQMFQSIPGLKVQASNCNNMDTIRLSEPSPEREETLQNRTKQALAGHAAETAEQKELIGYSSGKSRRELDVMHRVMRRGRAC